jgi:hypothetical protein
MRIHQIFARSGVMIFLVGNTQRPVDVFPCFRRSHKKRMMKPHLGEII